VSGRLGKRYARALFELARENGTLEITGEEIGRTVATFEEPRLRLLVLSPVIASDARVQTAKAVATALGLSKAVTNLVALLAERDRLTILPELARWYESFLDEEIGRARIMIRSATPLSISERNELVELARRLTRRREIVAATEVDTELIGGVVLDVGGTVYDGSVRTQLAHLSKEMTEGGR
jgi:F-type H+-transporting ATPase subunit delta